MKTKQIGNIGVSHAIHYFSKNGYTLCIPLNDSQDYDLVVEIDGELVKVQVKTTKQVTDYGVPKVTVKSMGGTSGTVYSRVRDSSAEYLYVYHYELDRAWFIPVTSDMPSTAINLGEKYNEFEVHL